jgi:hypothetical protein
MSKVLLIGTGDLAMRIALALSARGRAGEIVLAGRRVEPGLAMARMVHACGEAPSRYVQLNALNVDAVAECIQHEKPQVLVQCATLMSPWLLHERQDPVAQRLRSAGFAAQLCAQIPAVLQVMRAVRAAHHACSVVNCSFPDVTHPVLHRLGLAPTIGVGNAGMIEGLVRAALQPNGSPVRRLDVLAHHFHVAPVVTSDPARLRHWPGPRVYLDGRRVPDQEASLLFGAAPIPLARDINASSAAHAVRVIEALMPDADPLRTCAPGPGGRPGGWPVLIEQGRVCISLPDELTEEDAIAFHHRVAEGDGVERIDPDGTVHLTPLTREHLAGLPAELAAPLNPDEALQRFALLQRLLARTT